MGRGGGIQETERKKKRKKKKKRKRSRRRKVENNTRKTKGNTFSDGIVQTAAH